MPFPTPKVYIAFDDTPYALSPTWTEVTTDVLSMSIDRGRSDDWGSFNGSAQVVLLNTSRKYDPFNTTSVYTGKLLPRKQIKIEAVYGATTYPVFRGFLSGFPVEWTDAGKMSVVTLSCFDALQLLASEQVPQDWAKTYIKTLSPRHFFALDEPITPFTASTMFDIGSFPLNLTTKTNALNEGQLAVGLVNSSLGGIANTASGFDTIATNSLGFPLNPAYFTANSDFTIAFWVVPNGNATNGIINGETGKFTWNVSFTGGKFVLVVTSFGSNSIYTYTTVTSALQESEAVHFAFVWTASTFTAAIYVNGVNVTGTKTTTFGIVIPTDGDYVNILAGAIQQLCIWITARSQAEIQTIIKYSTAAFLETTSARFNRIIAQTSFPSGAPPTGLTSVPASPNSSVLEITDDAPYVAPELELVANTECAPLFVDRSGVVTMMGRYDRFTNTKSFNSQVTYGSGGIALGKEVSMQNNGDELRNVLNVSMSGGLQYQAVGSTTTAYGEISETYDTQADNPLQPIAIGLLLVGFGSQIFPSFEDIEVVLSPANDWSGTLGLELNERVTLAIAPPTGSTITKDILLQSIRHDVTPSQWVTSINGSNRWASVFRIGFSTIGGTDIILYK
jgi:hypothetical protein